MQPTAQAVGYLHEIVEQSSEGGKKCASAANRKFGNESGNGNLGTEME